MNSKKLKELVSLLLISIDKKDIKMIEYLIPELHIKLTNFVTENKKINNE